MQHDARIFVAGHRGMVGAAIVRKLEQAGYRNLVFRTSLELDVPKPCFQNICRAGFA